MAVNLVGILFSDAILAGGSIFSSGTTLQNDAGGLSSTQRAGIPVNAPEEGPGGGGFDYGTFDENVLLNSVFKMMLLLALVLLPLVAASR